MASSSFTTTATSAASESLEEFYDKRIKEAHIIGDPSKIGVTKVTLAELKQEGTHVPPGSMGAIKLQYPDQNGKITSFYRYRFAGTFSGYKYHQPKGTPVKCYLPAHKLFDKSFKDNFYNTNIPLIITEGEFKALTLVNNGLCALGLGGVSSISTKYGGGRALIEPLNSIPVGKIVYIAFDFDGSGVAVAPGAPKKEVHRAEQTLAAMLKLRGCYVYLVRLGDASSTEKVGIDDFINNNGIAALHEKLAEALEFSPTKEDGEVFLHTTYAVIGGDIASVESGKIYAASKFAILEANCKNPYTGEDKEAAKILPTQSFLKASNRTTLEQLTFDPSSNCIITKKHELNLWRGFKTKPIKGDVSLWLDFVNTFFSLDHDIMHHFEACMALTLQAPWIKQDRLCILMSGMTGIGKSFYFETIAAIINNSVKGTPNGMFNHAIVSSARDLDSDFNSILGDKKFVVFNEIGEKGEKHTNLLKDLVTGHSLSINEKYSKAQSRPNYLQICITTNENFTHLIEAHSRRELIYQIPKSDPLAMQLREYFAKAVELKEWINTEEARQALLYYYLNYDLKGYDGTQPAPINQSKLDVAEATKPLIDFYIEDELYDVSYIVPVLEYDRFIQHNPKSYLAYSGAMAAFKSQGYIKGPWDKANGQINFGLAAKDFKKLHRPIVLMQQSCTIPFSKEMVLEALVNRYYGNRKGKL
jgi:hypothetical protein